MTRPDTAPDTAPEAAARLPLWRAAFVIARRDFLAILLSKAFLFFLLGPLFFIAISGGAASLGRKAAENSTPAVLAVALPADEAARFVAARQTLDAMIDLPQIETVPPTDNPTDLLKARLEGNFGAVLSGSLAAPVLTGTSERIERWQGPVAIVAAQALGRSPAPYPAVTLHPSATSQASERRDRAGTATAGITLLFLLTMLLAGMVMSNLVEEKANKIIEVLAAAIPMDAVFLGKLVAMLGVSFVGIGVWGGVAGLIVAGGGAQLAALAAPAVGWPVFAALFLVYFAMSYLLIGSVFLTIGAMAPTVRDVQTLSMPATFAQLGVFFLATYSMTATGSPVERFAVGFPLSSPYAMVARAAQEPALWPHALALGYQALWVALFIRVGATLFRRRVMKSGPAAPDKPRWWRRARAA